MGNILLLYYNKTMKLTITIISLLALMISISQQAAIKSFFNSKTNVAFHSLYQELGS